MLVCAGLGDWLIGFFFNSPAYPNAFCLCAPRAEWSNSSLPFPSPKSPTPPVLQTTLKDCLWLPHASSHSHGKGSTESLLREYGMQWQKSSSWVPWGYPEPWMGSGPLYRSHQVDSSHRGLQPPLPPFRQACGKPSGASRAAAAGLGKPCLWRRACGSSSSSGGGAGALPAPFQLRSSGLFAPEAARGAGRGSAPPCPGECSAFPGSLHPGPCSGRVTGWELGAGLASRRLLPRLLSAFLWVMMIWVFWSLFILSASCSVVFVEFRLPCFLHLLRAEQDARVTEVAGLIPWACTCCACQPALPHYPFKNN